MPPLSQTSSRCSTRSVLIIAARADGSYRYSIVHFARILRLRAMSSSSSSTTGRRAPPGYVVDEIHIKVGHAGLKPLSSALNFLLKVGKDLVVEVEADAMTLRSLNDPKSAFASITFPVSFFDEYTLRVVPPKPAMSFKLALRPICAIMKNFRKVRSLVIRTDPNAQPAQGDDLQLFFEMDSEMGIRRIHKFTYMDSEVINAAFDEGSASSLRVQARNFTTYLQHIHQHSVEVQMDAAPDAFRVKSYHKVTVQDPLAAGGQAGQPRHMTTEMSIDLTEFEHYDYRAEEREVMLIFCLKELKGLLTLCDQTDVMDMELFFVESGAPVKVCLYMSRAMP